MIPLALVALVLLALFGLGRVLPEAIALGLGRFLAWGSALVATLFILYAVYVAAAIIPSNFGWYLLASIYAGIGASIFLVGQAARWALTPPPTHRHPLRR